MSKFFVYTDTDGSVGIVSVIDGLGEDHVKSIMPSGATGLREVTAKDFPETRVFRDAWDDSNTGSSIGVNLPKAKEVAHTIRREKREQFFKPNFEVIDKSLRGIPLIGVTKDAASQANADYKANIDDKAQISINAAKSATELLQLVKDLVG